jgi:hypothetical protein
VLAAIELGFVHCLRYALGKRGLSLCLWQSEPKFEDAFIQDVEVCPVLVLGDFVLSTHTAVKFNVEGECRGKRGEWTVRGRVSRF